MLGHGFLEWVDAFCHDGLGEDAAFVGFYADELFGAGAEGRDREDEGE